MRIAVLRALPGLGDLLCAVPALRSIRAAHPDARVTLVGLRQAAWVPATFPHLVDDLLVVDAWPGLPELGGSARAARAFAERARARRFDLALQLHGDGRASNGLLGALGARELAGSHLPGRAHPPGRFVTHPPAVHEVHRLLAVTGALRFPDEGDHLEWPCPSPRGGATAYACLHPGASVAERRWAPEGFAAVGDALARSGLEVVLTGTAGERDVSAAVARLMRCDARDLTGRTELGDLADLLAGAAVVVTNDTGTSHLAVAVEAPSVVLFKGTELDRWAPLDRDRHRVFDARRPAAEDLVPLVVDAALEQASTRLPSTTSARGAPAS